jgi:hypothetical protein
MSRIAGLAQSSKETISQSINICGVKYVLVTPCRMALPQRSLVHQAGPFRIHYFLVLIRWHSLCWLISLDFNKENTAPYVALEWNKYVLCFHTRSVRTKVALRAAIKVSQRKQLRQLLWRRKPSPARRPHHGNLLLCSGVLCTDDTLRPNVQGT